MGSELPNEQNSGSRWQRWEPHVHAPGTVLNDQFSGADAWEKYLSALEAVTPQLRAVGITDYYSTATYEKVLKAQAEGRLPNCALVFPNIEMRLGIGTVKGRHVNIHLLVSPEDPEHVAEVKRFLARLTFKAHGDSFACNPDDLIRLGRKADTSLTDPAAALEHGSQQFKVTLDELQTNYRSSDWARANILIAVAGSETDGTSGVRDAADATLRQEVEKFAHIIFASSAAQREFWLGRRAATESELRNRYGGLKPCLHGSDAHEQKAVGVPAGDRYSWLKGAAAFDTLRQACIDPAGRAYVGTEQPGAVTSSQVISRIEVTGAPWAKTPSIALNPGLVAIIGARGSGKTALADMIAAGCDAITDTLNDASFLKRASEYLGDAAVAVHWQIGNPIERSLDGSDTPAADRYPRARYLSQKFVEELCSADHVTDALLREIERVIFEAHSLVAREGAVDFDELLELRASRFRQAREREEDALSQLSDRIGTELDKEKQVAELAKQIDQKEKQIAAFKGDRDKLVVKGTEEKATRLNAVTTAAETVRSYLRFFANQEQSLLGLQDEVRDMRSNQAPETLRRAQESHVQSGIKGEEWNPFLLGFTGDVDTDLTARLKKSREQAAEWKGTPVAAGVDPNTPVISESAVLDRTPLALLEAEMVRLEKLIGGDRETTAKFSAIGRKIAAETAALATLKERHTDCSQAKERVVALVAQREAGYLRIFEAVEAEQSILTSLYAPLMQRLTAGQGTVRRLTFSVQRVADVAKWAESGEALLDLRHNGPFKGKGALQQRAEPVLKQAWESGNAVTVGAAMAKFRAENQEGLLGHSPVPKAVQSDYRAWSKRFAQWLYSTDHITIRYSIDYDGVDIRKLSPGTRGIVLLLLYLALDDADDRPLIIDQPEENLDPKSIFDELVGLFTESKSKRQVIMVTHNANLVVNTDADQIIVAEVGPHVAGQLPPITYTSGGLESEHIRKAVCDILEGGEPAFKERARRLRVKLDR
jgi:putative AbiEii toxin of type IV toxin-antitoxin system